MRQQRSDDGVRQERTGWRDETLNDRHRLWGWDCPAVDIDFLEYDEGKAVAVVEYKHEKAQVADPERDSKLKALKDLANRAKLPAFAVRYAEDFSWWLVVPLNNHARCCLAERERMAEWEWVALLYRLRGRVMPETLWRKGELGWQQRAA